MKKILNWLLVTIITVYGASQLTSCSNDDEPVDPQKYAGLPLIIFDTDIASSADDLFAMEMLYRYEEEGHCPALKHGQLRCWRRYAT